VVNDPEPARKRIGVRCVESSVQHIASSRANIRSRPGEAQMTSWVRFESAEGAGFGVLDGASIRVHEGDLFDGRSPPIAACRAVPFN
jgi:hypothetical protein